MTVTNFGPEPASSLILQSSTFVNEFGQFVTNPNECFLFLTVVDAVPTPYYYVNWPVAINGEPSYPPLAVGETRTCHFQFALTPQAPATTLFSWLFVKTYG